MVPTAEILALYIKGRELQAARLAYAPPDYPRRTPEYLEVWLRLHDLCGLMSWQESPLDAAKGNGDMCGRSILMRRAIERELLSGLCASRTSRPCKFGLGSESSGSHQGRR
jgi:hypothetical protein